MGGSIVGTYSGNFNGNEQGTFLVTVTANGLVSGSGQSSMTGAFNVAGRADPAGNLSLTATGSAGSAFYNGRIDTSSGAVTGTWRYQRGNGGGNFAGQRQ